MEADGKLQHIEPKMYFRKLPSADAWTEDITMFHTSRMYSVWWLMVSFV